MKRKYTVPLAAVALISLIALASCASAPSSASTASDAGAAAPNVATETVTFTLGSERGQREVIVFDVPVTGKIKAKAQWKGRSSGLSLILNGPGKVGCYQRTDGPSALTVSQTVTPELIALGTEWKISVVCWDTDTTVEGTLTVTYPK